jgi:hypothetical protein
MFGTRNAIFWNAGFSRLLSKEAVNPFLNFGPLTTAGVGKSLGFGEWHES